MVTARGIEKHAAFYRGYQPDDRSLLPIAIALATFVALCLLVYLISIVGPKPKSEAARSPHPSYAVSGPVVHRLGRDPVIAASNGSDEPASFFFSN